MFLQGRVILVWLSWLIGGICGVFILLVIICYCRLMPRHQKSFDEQYIKEHYVIKETHPHSSQENYRIVKQTEMQRHTRPASYAGDAEWRRAREAREAREGREGRREREPHPARTPHPPHSPAPDSHDHVVQYASSVLDELESGTNVDALKTRSLPAFLKPRPRPLSTEDDLHQLYAKVKLSKKYKSRMRSEHAAIIALSKSHSQLLDGDAVLVLDQRTAL